MKMESPIHYSNVMLFNSELNRGVRFRNEKNDAGVVSRVGVKTGEVLGA